SARKKDDSVKLWRETLDGISFVGVALKDASGIPRYFHLSQAEIPFTKNTHGV
ncbi:32098_t:CDS:2, partial [Racocetra persica]